MVLQITIKAIDKAADLVEASSHGVGFDFSIETGGGVGFVEGEIGGVGVHAGFEKFEGDVALFVAAITFGLRLNFFEPSHDVFQVVDQVEGGAIEGDG